MGQDEESFSSSPDPIAISGSGRPSHTDRPTRAYSLTPKMPLINTNGNIRLQDFYLTTPPTGVHRSSSPTKSIAQTENLVSPWRIRVTVEAEKDDGQETRSPPKTPSMRLAERTITTTVPLKGTNSSSPIQAKRGRGRPRKSLDTPIKRISTPGPKKSARRRSGPVIVDENTEIALQNTTQPKKARGRPRKSIGMEIGVQGIVDGVRREVQSNHGTTSAGQPSTSSVSTKEKSGGREGSVDRYKEGLYSDRIAHFKASRKVVQESTPSYNSEVNGQIRPMSSSSQRKRSDKRSTRTQTKYETEIMPTALEMRNVDITGAVDDLHATSLNFESLKSPNSLADPQGGHKKGNLLQDPTELNHEFDSILESEGFSMVSVSTLPSGQLNLSSVSKEQEPGIAALYNHGQTRSPKRDVPDIEIVEGVKEILTSQGVSTVPNSILEETINTSLLDFTPSPPSASNGSSQLYKVIQQQTPSQVLSSPSLPPPLQLAAPTQSPRALDKPAEDILKLNRIARAGNVLQGILGPLCPSTAESSSTSIPCTSSSTTRSIEQGQDVIFSGFGAGTRRELRAGLRLGEELARRQHFAAEAAAAGQRKGDGVFQVDPAYNRPKSSSPPKQEKYTLNMPCVERVVEYPNLPNRQLPSPEGSDPDEEDERMSWKADTPAKKGLENGERLRAWTPQDGMVQDLDRTMLAREAEWHLEREAVSRQIQQANTSQVIVIDSSTMNQSEDGTEDEGCEEEEVEDKDDESPEEKKDGADDGETIDIWQSEAQQSSRSEQSTSYEVPEVLFPEEVVKPRRSKLPSPWRRLSKLVYSDEVEPTNEAIVRLPDLKHAVTPQESEKRKRSRLDVSNYSIISDFALKPDDESTMLPGDESLSAKTVEEETPMKKTKVSRTLSHAEYYAKIEDDIDDTWTLDDPDLDVKNSPASNQGPAMAAMKAESWEIVSASGEPARTATSWLSRVTSYVPMLRSLAPTNRANSSLPLVFSNSPVYSPKSPPASDVLSIYLPWANVHYLSLRSFYLAAKKDKRLYIFNPESSSAHLLGQDMCSMGWKKPVEKWELGVVDAFLNHLDAVGVDNGGLDEDGTERLLIDELEVARRVFSLWVGEVQRQEAPVGSGTVGMFDVRHQWRKATVLKAAAEGR